MILLDTSVLIHFLRTADPKIAAVLTANSVAVSVVTRAEILHGSKSEPDFRKLTAMLDQFLQVGVEPDPWDDLARNLYELRRRGIVVPFPDALIATIAIRNSLDLYAYDKHFPLVKAAFPSLKLFVEPP